MRTKRYAQARRHAAPARMGVRMLALLVSICVLAAPGAALATQEAPPGIGWTRMTLDDAQSGRFSVQVRNIPQEDPELYAHVVCNGDEDRAQDLPMREDGAGWTAASTVAEFQHQYGEYTAEIYTPEDGYIRIWGSASLSIRPEGEISLSASPIGASQIFWRLSLTGGRLPGDPSVWFEVVSPRGESTVFPARWTGSAYQSLASPVNRGETGTYAVRATCGDTQEDAVGIAETTLTVDGVSSASLSFENVDAAAGTFDLRLAAQAPAGVRSARACVWTRDDRGDLLWVDLAPSGEDWQASFDMTENFAGSFGTYHAEAHVTLANGIQLRAAGAERLIQATNRVWHEHPQTGKWLVHVTNPQPAESLRVAVWSEAGGQDDLVWYDATLDDGVATATIATRRLRSSGLVHAHAYSGSTLLGATQFDVPTSEIRNLPVISNPPTKRNGWGFNRRWDGGVPAATWTAEQLKPYDAYYVGDTSRKEIYLTFDAGYGNESTARILDTLKRNNVKAAFFVTESMVRYSPDLVRRMADEGHLVCNHTATHPEMSGLSQTRISQEIRSCEDAYRRVTGKQMDPFLRPPEGVFSGRSLLYTRNNGYTTVFWSLAHMDWDVNRQPSVSQAYNIMVETAHPGCIMLLHAISSANAGALDSAIRTLRSQGYEFKTLYDLPC